MARTILFDFKGQTRSARAAFRSMRRGLSDVRRGYLETRRAGRDLMTRNGSLSTSFLSLGRGIGSMGIGMARFAMGPAGLVIRALGSIMSVARSVVTTIAKVTLGFAAVTAAVGVKAVSAFASFEQRMVRVREIAASTPEEWERIAAAIEKVILESEHLPDTIALAAEKIRAAGMHSAEAMEQLLPSAAQLATALGVDINDAAEQLMGTLTMFNLGVEDAAHVSDLFVNAWKGSQATFEYIRDAMPSFGPLMANMNQDLKTSITLLMALANAKIPASTAGVSLRMLFGTLRQDTPTLNKALKNTGLTLDDVSVASTNALEVLDNLNQLTQQNIFEIFRVNGEDVALMLRDLVKSGKGETRSLVELGHALDIVGSAMGMAAAQTDTVMGRWNILRGSASKANIELGALIERTLGVKGGFAGLATDVNSLSAALKTISGESMRDLGNAILADWKSGRLVNAIQELFQGVWEVTKPLAVWLGGNIALGILKGISELGAYLTGQIWGLLPGIDAKDVQKVVSDISIPNWVGFMPFPREGIAPGAERIQSALDLEAGPMRNSEMLEAVRELIKVLRDGQAPVPAPALIDNRKIVNYGVPSERTERGSRSAGIDTGTGGRR